MSRVLVCPNRKSLPCFFREASRELAEGLAEARASQQSEARKAQVEAVWPPGPPKPLQSGCCFFIFSYSMHVEYVTKATPWYKREIWLIRLLLLQICSTALQRLRPLPRNSDMFLAFVASLNSMFKLRFNESLCRAVCSFDLRWLVGVCRGQSEDGCHEDLDLISNRTSAVAKGRGLDGFDGCVWKPTFPKSFQRRFFRLRV